MQPSRGCIVEDRHARANSAEECAEESEAFGGKPRRLRSNRAHERSEVAARSRAGRGRTRGLAARGRPDGHPRRRGEDRPRRRYSAEAGCPASGGCGGRRRPDARRGGKRGRTRNARTRQRQPRGIPPPQADAPARKGPDREADAAEANLAIGERCGTRATRPFPLGANGWGGITRMLGRSAGRRPPCEFTRGRLGGFTSDASRAT